MSPLRDTVLSRRQIEGLIADGRKIFILDGQVVKADAWLPFHPGGQTAIMHMVGKDGTDEIRALHSPEAQQQMQRFVIGKLQGRWYNFVPPIQGGIFRPYNGEEEESAVDADEDNDDSLGEISSSSSTESLTPIFDTTNHLQEGFRKRRLSYETSISSASSQTSAEESVPAPVMEKKGKGNDLVTSGTSLSDEKERFPPLDAATQDLIKEKYRVLNDRIREQGLYNCHYTSYLVEVCRYSILLASFVFLLRTGHYYLSAASLGLLWHQVVFTAHDAGHMGITHNYQIDSMIGIFIADFVGGLSIGWWKRSHNVHHIITNAPEHDPDIELMPFFAISSRFFQDLRSSYYDSIMPYDAFAKFVVPYQNYLYYPVLTLGRFNLYLLSWHHLFFYPGPHKGAARYHRHLEILGQLFFWTWFGYGTLYRSIPTNLDRVIFILISHMITAVLHVQITLSHFAMSTTDMGPHESFPQRMLRTTMDVDCPPWLDFFHGGLQFQAIHHLFPRLPRHNLRRCQGLVDQFCRDVAIPYTRYGFVEGNGQVLGHLGHVAGQARLLEECRRVVAGKEGAMASLIGIEHEHEH